MEAFELLVVFVKTRTMSQLCATSWGIVLSTSGKQGHGMRIVARRTGDGLARD